MKLVIVGDFHIRSSNPENRVDEYKETMRGKIQSILSFAKAAPILQPGDFFDSPIQSNAMLSDCFEIFRDSNIHTVFGQHDLRFRTKGNTALDVLIAGGIVKNEALTALQPSVFLYYCSYNEDIPEVETKGFNILLIHKMIVEEKLWEGQVDHEWANSILRRTRFDLVVSGDNHKSFFVEQKGRHLINCGSLMRSSRDQIDHKPCIVIYDTDKRKYMVHFIPIKPSALVFDMNKIIAEEKRDEKLSAFIESLIEGGGIGLDFKGNLDSALRRNKIGDEIVSIITEAMKGDS